MTPAHPPSTDTHTVWARPFYERQVTRLDRLAEIGMGLAETLERQVTAAAETDPPDVSERAYMAFSRIARAVRLTLMLQARLIQELEDRERRAAADADHAARLGQSARITQTFEQAERAGRIIERVAEGGDVLPDEVERLAREARERLDQDDIYGDILDRPLSELIAVICQDLGLDPDWPKLAQEAWAREERAGGEPGWPLADLAGLAADQGCGSESLVQLRRRGASP